MQITDNLYSFKNRVVRSNAKLITGEKVILIDPGTNSENNVNYLISELKKINVTRIDEIWITHVHPDHSQAIPFLKQKFKAKLRAHPIAKSILESRHPAAAFIEQQLNAAKPVLDYLFPGEYRKHKFLLCLIRTIIRFYVNTITINWRKTKVDYAFTDNEILYGWKVLYLPGHTDEEVGFYSKDTNILLSGDVIARKRKRTTPVLNTITSDIDKAISTLKIMQNLNPKLIIPGHCGILYEPDKIISQFLSEAQSLKSKSLNILSMGVFCRDTMPCVSKDCHSESPEAKKDLSSAFCPSSQPANEITFFSRPLNTNSVGTIRDRYPAISGDTVYRLLRFFYSLWQIHPPSIRFQERLALFFVLIKILIDSPPKNIYPHLKCFLVFLL